MQIRNEEDFWSGIMFIGVGLGFAIAAQRYGMGTLRSMGPGLYPTGVGLAMAVLGATLSAKSMKELDQVRIEPFGWRGLAALLGGLTLFCVLMPYLGLIVSLALLVFGSALAIRDFKWREALTVTVVLTALGWLIFIAGLGIQAQVWPVFLGD